jgi:hypothetical protein
VKGDALKEWIPTLVAGIAILASLFNFIFSIRLNRQKADRDLIFKRGLQGSNSNRSGNGLGLAIAMEEATKLGGSIEQFTRPRRRPDQRYVQNVFKINIPQDKPAEITSEGIVGI